jgi:hypothetical protein
MEDRFGKTLSYHRLDTHCVAQPKSHRAGWDRNLAEGGLLGGNLEEGAAAVLAIALVPALVPA